MRYQTLWPMPGGANTYIESLRDILRIVERAASTSDAVAAVIASFPGVSSAKTAYSYLKVPTYLGLAFLDGPICELTGDGQKYLLSGQPADLRELLVERVAGVRELLELIAARPRRIGLLHAAMTDQGFGWSRDTQVRYRLRWLEAVGAISREGKARPLYRLTSA